MNYRAKIISLALMVTLIGSQSALGNTANAAPFLRALFAALPTLPQVSFPKVDLGVGQRVDNISDSLDYAAYSMHYVGLYGTPAINGLSKSINHLVNDGIKSAGICATGVIAATCGLGIITNTVLNDNAKNKKTKFAFGAGLSAMGIAAVMCSNWLTSIKS